MIKEREKKIVENIKKIRKRAGLTQDYVATKLQLLGCDLSRSTVAKIESGERHLYVDEIWYFKQVLGVNYDKIFED